MIGNNLADDVGNEKEDMMMLLFLNQFFDCLKLCTKKKMKVDKYKDIEISWGQKFC